MGIENWSERVMLVNLSGEPEMVDDLAEVAECLSSRDDCDVIVDCSQAERVGCSSCRQLLELNDTLSAHGHRLVLCGSKAKSSEAFAAPALAHVLRFADDRFTALARLGVAYE
jgi:anti-anti-sigma regulatory factor